VFCFFNGYSHAPRGAECEEGVKVLLHVSVFPFWHFDYVTDSKAWFIPSFRNASNIMTTPFYVVAQLQMLARTKAGQRDSTFLSDSLDNDPVSDVRLALRKSFQCHIKRRLVLVEKGKDLVAQHLTLV
jgi:hypothetical protein